MDICSYSYLISSFCNLFLWNCLIKNGGVEAKVKCRICITARSIESLGVETMPEILCVSINTLETEGRGYYYNDVGKCERNFRKKMGFLIMVVGKQQQDEQYALYFLASIFSFSSFWKPGEFSFLVGSRERGHLLPSENSCGRIDSISVLINSKMDIPLCRSCGISARPVLGCRPQQQRRLLKWDEGYC